MARSKLATKAKKALKVPVVKPAWPTNEANTNNTEFLQPEDFMIPRNIMVELLGHIPCRYSHKDYLLASRLLHSLDKMLEDDTGTLTDSQDTLDNSATREVETEMNGRRESSIKAIAAEVKKAQIRAKSPRVTATEWNRMKKFGSMASHRRCIALTLLAVKYAQVLKLMIEACDFFTNHPELREDPSLVRVIFIDYLDRQLEIRTPFANEEKLERCEAVEQAIKQMHVRIGGDFARLRIKMRAPELADMLDDKMRDIDKAVRKMPVYAWVNQLLASITQTISQLEKAGFTYDVTPSTRQPSRGCFHRDIHCDDLLLFNRGDVDKLEGLEVFKKLFLHFGDKLECLVITLIMQKCNVKMTVTLINPMSLSLALHMESLYVSRYGPENLKNRKFVRVIFAGTGFRAQEDEIHHLEQAGASSFTIQEDSAITGKWSASDLALVYGSSSMTGIIDPLEYLAVAERADSAILYNVLEYNHNAVMDPNTPYYLRTSVDCLKNVFEVPALQSIVFFAHSIRSAETSHLLRKSIELANHRSQQTSSLQWVIANPVPDSFKTTDNIGKTAEMDGIVMSPSKEGNGGYIGVVERQLGQAMAPHTAKKPETTSRKENGKKTASASSNINNKFRGTVTKMVKQQNHHHKMPRWHEKKWLASREHGGGARKERRVSLRTVSASATVDRRLDGDGLQIVDL